MSDSTIVKEKIEYLRTRIGMPLPVFVASDEELLWISGDRFNTIAINHLVSHIMIHLKAAYVKFTINLCFIDETNRPGEYSNKFGPVINLHLARDYTTAQIIAIVCHECTHHYLFSRGIRIEDEHENEILTDVAAIYLGFGNYLAEGYKPTQKVVSYSINSRVIRTSRIGYITEQQIAIAKNEIDNLNKSVDEINELRESAIKDCEMLKMLISVNDGLVMQICADKKANFTKADYDIFQDNMRKNDTHEYYRCYELFLGKLSKVNTQKDYKQFEKDINKICTEIAGRNTMLGRYI